MLKKIMYLLLFAVSLSSAGAEIPTAPNKLDADSLKQGQWLYYMNAEDVITQDSVDAAYYQLINYINNKPDGLVRAYYMSGELRGEYYLISANPMMFDGKYTSYHKNGQINATGEFTEGKPQGEWKYYFTDGSVDEATPAFNLAVSYYQTGKYDKSIELIKKAMEIRKEKLGESDDDYIKCVLQYGLFTALKGNLSESEKIILNAKELTEKYFGVTHPGYSAAVYYLSGIYLRLHRYQDALKYSLEDLEITQKTIGENNHNYAQGLNNIASIYKVMGDYDKAIETAGQALELHEKLSGKNSPGYSNSIFYLATIYREKGDYPQSVKYFLEAIEITKKVMGEEHPDIWTTMNSLANVYQLMGQYPKAEEYILRSMEKRKQIFGDKSVQYADNNFNLGHLYLLMGRYTESVEAFNISYEVYKTLFGENDQHTANVGSAIAVLYEIMGKYAEAEELIKKNLDITGQSLGKGHPNYATALGNLAKINMKMGRYQEAESLWKEAIAILEAKFKDGHPKIINSRGNLASLYIARGEYNKALPILENACDYWLKFYGTEKHQQYASEVINLANTFRGLRQYEKADSLFKKSISLVREILGEKHEYYPKVLAGRGVLLWEMNKYEEAGPILLEVTEILKKEFGANHPDFVQSLFYCANLYNSTGETDKSAGYFHECLTKTFEMTKRYFPSLSESEKMNFWNTLSRRVEIFNDFAARHENHAGVLNDMYDYSLLSKGLILEAKKKSLSKARGLSRLLKNWQATREYWMKLIQNPQKAKQMGVDIDSVEKAANEYEKMLSSQSSGMKKELDTTIVRWQDVQKMLKPNEAAIEIIRFRKFDKVITDKVQYAALILKNRKDKPIELVLLENGNDIEALLLKQYMKHIQKQKHSGFSGLEDYLLKEIYNQIWSEIDKKLDGIETIYLSPDGVFNKINLNTLINPETGKFLIDELNIHLMTSTRDLSDKSKFKVYGNLMMPENNAVLFGNPAFNLNYIDDDDMNSQELYAGTSLKRVLSASIERGAITPLPGTEKEINLISEQLNNKHWKTETFFGKNALEKNIKSLESPKILHIATHGVFLEDLETEKSTMGIENERYIENPLLRSMLLFAGSARTISGATGGDSPERDINDINGGSWGEDGILTAYEVINLDLEGTELVVLSACKTGLGEVKNGEGVYGLQRAFQVAGAKTIIMSLWSVDDKTTQELMTSFYEKWLSGMNKREAFNKAQAEMKGKYSQPYYWGAFVMVGE